MKKLLIALLMLALLLSAAMAEDAVIDFENGSAGVFQQSGSCSVAVTDAIAHEGGKSLAITGRSGNNWDCADLVAARAGIALGDKVTITAWVYVDSDEEGTFVIAKSAADYGWYGNATIPGKTWTEVTATFTLEDDVNIRFQNYGDNWNAVNFYIVLLIASALDFRNDVIKSAFRNFHRYHYAVSVILKTVDIGVKPLLNYLGVSKQRSVFCLAGDGVIMSARSIHTRCAHKKRQ